MKRILMISALAAMAIAGCKKKENQVSTIVTVSYPTITISTPKFYSIPVGGTIPDPNGIVATAYDSFYHENITTIVKDASKVSTLTPGLYTITVSAKSQYGYIGYDNVYIAVTDVADTVDVSGFYLRSLGGAADPNRPAIVTKVARGLFRTSNLGGVDTTGLPTSLIPAYFVVTSATAVDLGNQAIPNTKTTGADVITGSYGALDLVTIPNSYSYAFSDQQGVFGTSVRTFVKQ
jgi:hypothetical protein